MAPIGSGTTGGASGSGANSTSGTTSGSTEVTKNMFLQLLVAQLKNQDPLNPSDGTQFITQLAQFQQLEQSMNSGQDIAAILQDVNQIVATTQAGGSTQAS